MNALQRMDRYQKEVSTEKNEKRAGSVYLYNNTDLCIYFMLNSHLTCSH